MSRSYGSGVLLASINQFPVYRIGTPSIRFHQLPVHALPARLDVSAFRPFSTVESLYCQELSGEATAVVFEAVGKFREDEFYMTTHGRPEEECGDDRGWEACCWVESPSGDAKLSSQWSQMMRALHLITLRHTLQDPKRRQTPGTLLRMDNHGVTLKIGWSLRDKASGTSRATRLPFFNSFAVHRPPRTAKDVDFDRLVSVTFTLRSLEDDRARTSYYADLQSVVLLDYA